LKAWLNLRYTLPERIAVFTSGLQRLGYEVVPGVTTTPGDRDILVTWNRIKHGDVAAREFEARGRPVLVTENASWGNHFAGADWYSLALNYHNSAGRFQIGGPERWDDLGVELDHWRVGHGMLILPQRGIGPPGVAMPAGWIDDAYRRHGGRVRRHPGRDKCRPLEDDLEGIGKVVTWGSGAAIKALMWGIPAVSEMPGWIGEQDNTCDGRLAMFRRLAWAQTRISEIKDGSAFDRLLRC
jgi:hypothetical protein